MDPPAGVDWLQSVRATAEATKKMVRERQKAAIPPHLGQADLWSLVGEGFTTPGLAAAVAQAGDLVRVAANGPAMMLFGRPKHLKAAAQPKRQVSAMSSAVRPANVTEILHRLGEGDYVITLGSALKLGHIELARLSAGDDAEYLVRTMPDGKRWADHSYAWAARYLWPLSSEAVVAVLAAKGLPGPPAIVTSRSASVDGSVAPLTAGLPRLPTLRTAGAGEAEVEPAGPPMPPGEFTQDFARVAFPGQLRRYQAMAVDAFELARAAGRRRAYLVLPPGAGKTLVGLEIARRLGNRTLALGPNTAIQEQWVKQWRSYQPTTVAAGDSPDLSVPVTALTYQSICNLDAHNPALDQQIAEWEHQTDGEHPSAGDGNPHHSADAARLRGHARKLIAEAGDHEKLLSILHPNGRELIERIKSGGQFTIILDECHHLLEMWGYLLRALVHELGDGVFLVGLTATPPAEMDARESVLYQELFGRADFEVPTPAVVKEGNLAPYQELAYVTSPLDLELAYIAEEKTRFEELITEMSRPDLGTVSFLDWLRSRVFERRTREGVQVAWSRFETDHPLLALAALRYCYANEVPLPEGARLGEAQRRHPDAGDWVVLIGDYCTGHLRESSDPIDLEAWEMIRRSLPSLGFTLTRQGIRAYVSPVDRVLLLSASKGLAATEILRAESGALGDRLRALLLCDYEVAGSELVGKLRGILDAQAGSAALLLRTLLGDAATADLDPILVTGQTVACSRATAAALIPWLGEAWPGLRDRLQLDALFKPVEGESGDWGAVVEIRPTGTSWSSRLYLPLLTRYFEEGRSRCLLGTRGLLGEGWDAKSINVLIDLTGVTTTTSVHQMRGRSLRLDPGLPRKVANNWDVVCVARDHPKGSADYDRFVRKHRNYFSITAAGEIESGVGHVDPRLSPFGPPTGDVLGAVNSGALERAGGREHVYQLWGIGKPYRNLPIQTVRIHSARPIGVSSRGLITGTSAAPSPALLRTRVIGGTVIGAGLLWWGVAAGQDVLGIGAGIALAAGGIGSAAAAVRKQAARLGPSSALEDLGAAVADGLAATGQIGPHLGAGAVRLAAQPDGYYRCYLEGAELRDSALFATSLDELLAPIQSPRYVIPRYVPVPPSGMVDSLRLLAAHFGSQRLGAAVVYHAVPSALATNRERAKAFEVAWNRLVSSGHALYAEDPQAQAIIQLQRGEDPFAVTTQMRTLWE